ncbi:MAG TPA: hypothetical protein VMA31_13190 [Bryobacteraceae bacterium]|nr:hypothetical protein [Bryobacteraceae bacterium]
MLAAYSNTWLAGFALDNRPLILEDPRLRAATAGNLDLILNHTYWWPYAETGLYRPFTTLSFLFNYAVLGDGAHPAGYHAINLLLHAVNVLLAYALVLRLFSGRWTALAAAGLWAVHPVLTESVTNIVGRSDLLAGAAILGGLRLHIRGAAAAGFAKFAWLACLATVTTLGLFSKESAVAVVGVLAVYEFFQPKRPTLGRLLPSTAAVLLPVMAMWCVRSQVLASAPPAVLPFTDNPLVAGGFWQSKLTALSILGRYIWLTVWPAHLSADYSYAQVPPAHGSTADWAAWLTVAMTLALAAFLYRRAGRPRVAAFFLLFAFVNLVPVANLLFPIGTIMAERFLYLSSLGICVCVVMLVDSLCSSRVAAAVLVVAIAAAGARTYARNADWRDDLSLASADVEVAPGSYKTHLRLATALNEADTQNLDRAIGEVEKSLSIVDGLPDVRNTPTVYLSAGTWYLAQGERLRKAETVTPSAQSSYEKAAHVLQRGLAVIHALRAAGAHPAFREEADAEHMLSAAWLHLGETQPALESALAARRLNPLDPQAHWQIFTVLMSQNRTYEAGTALMMGGLITGDSSLRGALIRLYQMGLDTIGCAVVRGSVLNPACGIVAGQICAATAGLERLEHETPSPEAAEGLRALLATSVCRDNRGQ